MKTFVRAIQAGRWLYDGSSENFDIFKASSDALTVDMSSLNRELSVYELVLNTQEEIEFIAIKVFLDCLNNFQNGVTLVILTEDFIKEHGYSYEADFSENPFGVKHYNVVNVSRGEDIVGIANHIGSTELIKDNLVDFTLEDMFSLMAKHDGLVKEYKMFKSKKSKLKDLYSKLGSTRQFTCLFE